MPPPVPAAYLQGLPQIPADLYEALDGRRHVPRTLHRKLQGMIRRLARMIRARRQAYEREHGVIIVPETPHDGGLRPGECNLLDWLASGRPLPQGIRRR